MDLTTEVELKDCFSNPLLDVMNFLNEVVLEFPSAISFAPGRPIEALFRVQACLAGIEDFVTDRAVRKGIPREEVWNDIGQYNRTNGVINELIAQHLDRDEGIHVAAAAVMVTVGAQEAMVILLAGLFDPGRDILLVSDPTYIGISGLARILGIRISPVPSGDDGLTPQALEEVIAQESRVGRIRALYDIPDFNNPLGTTMPLKRRLEVLEVCHRYNILFFEDNAYGMFSYDGNRMPTMRRLDQHGNVVYIGSFSKTIFPGLRLGYLVASQRVRGTGQFLAEELSKVKSLITVNTPTLCQAILASILHRFDYSLEPVVEPKRVQLQRNRDEMLECLAREFSGFESLVTWNRPRGGFFLTITLPFEFGNAEMRKCAAEYGVIVCPMNFFALRQDRANQIRLSFSYVTPTQIRMGVASLSRFFRDRWAKR